jgi:hypothetical protein
MVCEEKMSPLGKQSRGISERPKPCLNNATRGDSPQCQENIHKKEKKKQRYIQTEMKKLADEQLKGMQLPPCLIRYTP